MKKNINRFQIYLPVAGLLAIFLILDIASLRHKTFTNDEEEYYWYGMSVLEGNSNREINQATMPIAVVNALPGKLGSYLPEGPVKAFLLRVETGRYVTIGFALLLGLVIFRWSRLLYGIGAGYFSLFLYTFSPSFIAHSRLITTDLYATFFMTLTVYYFWRFSNLRGGKDLIAVAVLLGISQLVKCTCLLLYPILAVVAAFHFGPRILRAVGKRDGTAVVSGLFRTAGVFLIFLSVSILIINIGFLGNGTGTPLSRYRFRSELFGSIQNGLGRIADLPLPLPAPYLRGFDALVWEGETGNRANNHLLGETRPGNQGFTGYFFFAFLFKVPIAAQLFILLGIIFYLINRKKYRFLSDELFLVGPVVVFWGYINFFSVYNAGIRYSIMVFPLLYIFSGNLIRSSMVRKAGGRIALLLLGLYLVVSVLSYFPHYISYFNEIVWDRKTGYRYLAGTNINWGQNRWYRDRYLEAHPEVHPNRVKPRPGKVLVNVNRLIADSYPDEFRWLRENFEPVNHVAYSYLIFDITEMDLKRIQERKLIRGEKQKN